MSYCNQCYDGNHYECENSDYVECKCNCICSHCGENDHDNCIGKWCACGECD